MDTGMLMWQYLEEGKHFLSASPFNRYYRYSKSLAIVCFDLRWERSIQEGEGRNIERKAVKLWWWRAEASSSGRSLSHWSGVFPLTDLGSLLDSSSPQIYHSQLRDLSVSIRFWLVFLLLGVVVFHVWWWFDEREAKMNPRCSSIFGKKIVLMWSLIQIFFIFYILSFSFFC